MDAINDQLSILKVGRYAEEDLLEDVDEEACSFFENSGPSKEIDVEEEDRVNESIDYEMLIQAFQTIMHLSKGEEE